MRISLILNKTTSGVLRGNFYVTTPIYYVNASPHIGHLYSSVIADAIHRWHKLINPGGKFKFATGTDEHGSKIQQAAKSKSVSLPIYCKEISDSYRKLSENFNIQYTDFIRTSEENHKKAVQHFWTTIYNKGHIYLTKYSGWYCVSDETFLTESQLKESIAPDGSKIKISAESGHIVEWTEEENYMFKLSSFKSQLLHWLKNEGVVKPKKFQKILLDMLEEDLPDVSVSRPISRVHWGIKVPKDETQTVYVWLDALVNYLTADGYPEHLSHWPADVHVIGKDILKFHGLYWPAFLMAADIEPPKSILCHSHWTVDGEKMSKSKNNVVCPFDRAEFYTTDGFRYFLLREGVAHSDGNYSETKILRILNAELADTFGNLLSRCSATTINQKQLFPSIQKESFRSVCSLDITKRLIESIEALPDICFTHYSEYNFYKVVDATISTLHITNLFFETLRPWELKKNPALQSDLDVVLNLTLETLRISAIVLSPIIPNLSNNMLNKMNVPGEMRTWDSVKNLSWKDPDFKSKELGSEKMVLFKRIVLPKEDKKKKVKA